MEECDCIIPAAGRSERMGRWKPVLPFGDSSIIQTVAASALRACPRVILVTGYRGGELAAIFRGEPRVHPVVNEDWPLGIFGSVRLGVSHAATARFFVTLGDMPWITEAVYQALLGEDEADVVFPVHDGRRGHPVLFHERVKPAIAAANPSRGSMRAIVESFRVREMPWPDASILRDIDTESDLK